MIDYTGYKLVTHKNCMDGAGCAILYRALGGRQEDIHFTNPGHEQSDELVKELLIEKGHAVLIADVSISVEAAKELFSPHNLRTHVCELVDHHKSAIPLDNLGLPGFEIDVQNSRCGCKMLFDFFLKASVGDNKVIRAYADLVNVIDDHDRWIKQDSRSDDIAMLYMVLGQKLFIERFIKNPQIEFTNEEKYVISLEKYKMQEEIEEKKRTVQSAIYNRKINGKTYRFGFVYGTRFTSSTGNALYEDPSLNLDAVVLVSGNTISMRTAKSSEVDVSAIASNYGGGGHRAAAGFSIKALLGQTLVEFVADKMKVEGK